MSAAGRPRSTEVSEAILGAVLDLIAQQGSIAAVSVDAVAARSGASKATIYRRWSSKEELVAAAVDSIKSKPEVELPHESLRDDLIRIGRSVRTQLSDEERVVLRCIAVEAGSNPELGRQQERFVSRRREVLRGVFRYWAEQGVIRQDVDVRVAAAMFISPLLMVMVYGHDPELRRRDLVEDLADNLIRGIQA